MSLIPQKDLETQQEIYDDESYHNNNLKVINNGAGILVDLLKNLKSGANLTNVLCPVALLKRFSLLEMYSYISQPKAYLFNLDKKTPEDRFLNVCKWILENQTIFPQSGMQDIKPLNPVLGEYFDMEFEHGDGIDNTRFIAEQTSHHPPITAVYMENKQQGFMYEQVQQPMPKFYGTSAHSLIEGTNVLTLTKLKEVYTITMPAACMRSILLFTAYLEQNGEMTIRCNETGYFMSMMFKKAKNYKVKGYIAKINETNAAKAKKIYKLSGAINSKIYISPAKNEKDKQVFVDINNIQLEKRVIKKVSEQGLYESQRVWHGVRYGIYKNDFDTALKHKTDVEVSQRAVRKERKDKGETWTPQFFDQLTDRQAGAETPYFQYKNRLK
mmetsp:Transcript_8707/g.12871  ORF Transcript_8707/g.12871 Transcript_8707/m.12871 type:complete len:384 (+) Transcript_8707:138-1289(+)